MIMHIIKVTKLKISDKKMRKIYNPLVQKVSAIYEPRYDLNVQWGNFLMNVIIKLLIIFYLDKYDRE